MVHELAHAWWGNKVAPAGPGAPLINEGLASFTGMSFFEERDGRARAIEGSEFGSATGSPDATLYGYVDLWRSGKDVALARLKAGVGDHYNIAQTKGVWVLRMLRDRIGRDAFYGALRRITAERSTLDLAGLRDSLRQAAPADAGLEAFLTQWLDQPGIPVLDVRWRNATDGDRRHATIAIFQRQAGVPYDLTVDLRIRTRKGLVARTVALAGIDTQADVDVPDDVVGIEIDPEHKLLLWRPAFGDPMLASH
jgi:aminopeptidase N